MNAIATRTQSDPAHFLKIEVPVPSTPDLMIVIYPVVTLSAGGKVFPPGAVCAAGGIHHAALHAAVWLDPGHHDPHAPIVGPRRGRTAQKAQRVEPGEVL